MKSESQLLRALIEEPTRYNIDVIDNSMLPPSMKGKKTIDFVIKPPTLETLSVCAQFLHQVPDEILKAETLSLKEAAPYMGVMIKVICAHSYNKPNYPEWYEPFFYKNITPKEVFGIFQEVSLKMQTDFFLTSFQIAAKSNPMMMHLPDEGSTPTN